MAKGKSKRHRGFRGGARPDDGPPYFLRFTASLSPLPARNTAAVDALMVISFPVRGLRPLRAPRLRVSKLPKPVIWTLPPFLS